MRGIQQSAESRTKLVQDFYVALLNRPAEPAGLATWLRTARSALGDPAEAPLDEVARRYLLGAGGIARAASSAKLIAEGRGAAVSAKEPTALIAPDIQPALAIA